MQVKQSIWHTDWVRVCVHWVYSLVPSTLNWQGRLQQHTRHLELAKVLRAWKATLPSLCWGRLGSAPPPLVQVQSKLSGEGTWGWLVTCWFQPWYCPDRGTNCRTFYLTANLNFSRRSDPPNVVCLRFCDFSFFGAIFSPASSDHEKQIHEVMHVLN